jgi:DUF4097 and DUF4098 domain-containing protein YvlB
MGTLEAVLAILLAHNDALDVRRPAAPDARIEIQNHAGSTTVIGWDHEEVYVTGSLGHGTEGVDIEGNEHRLEISARHRGGQGESDLEVHVPKGSRVEVHGHSADVKVSGVQGTVSVGVVSGTITVSGPCQAIEVSTVSGDIHVDAVSKKTRAESVSGDVTVRGISGEVDASSVNGELVIEGKLIEVGKLETVSGDLKFIGDLTPEGSLSTQTVSGEIQIVLPATISADFEASSFSGDIEDEWGKAAHATSTHVSSKELSFKTGTGGAKVSARTLSGNIEIHKRGSGNND